MNSFGFNGQERKDDYKGKGNHNHALYWEYDTRIGRRWNLDPKPQVNISDYAVMGNSPIWFIDPLGDEIRITHRKGFLGLGEKQTLKYEDGKLYNLDGTDYTGKVNGFLGKTVGALNQAKTTAEGAALQKKLEMSFNVFTIEKGMKSEFIPSNTLKATAYQRVDEATGASGDLSGGSGGTIIFNPTQGGVREQGGVTATRPTTTLAHEMSHALDADRGLMDYRIEQGIQRNEWQAVYRENLIRSQLGLPLRTYYSSGGDGTSALTVPTGPYLLDKTNKSILPYWYKP